MQAIQLGINCCKNAVLKLGRMQVNREVGTVRREHNVQQAPNKVTVDMPKLDIVVDDSTRGGNVSMEIDTYIDVNEISPLLTVLPDANSTPTSTRKYVVKQAMRQRPEITY